MPGVPEINVPTVQGDSTPLVQTPAPGAGAFGAGIGAGLTAIGEGLHSYGMDSYHAAVKATAQEKETEFQTEALKLRDQYRTKFNMDAISAHGPITKALEDARKRIVASIPTKSGQSLFNDNSLRVQRFAQESIDSHFETQNKQYKVVVQKNADFADARTVASNSLPVQGEVYDPTKNEALIEHQKARSLEFAKSHGMDDETADQYAANSVQKTTDAMFKALLKAGKLGTVSSEQIQNELKKYTDKGMVSANVQSTATATIGGLGVTQWVNKTMAKLDTERYDYRGNYTPEGHIPQAKFDEQLGNLSIGDPQYEAKVKMLTEEYNRRTASDASAGRQLANQVVRDGVVGREDSELWQKYKDLHPIQAEELKQKFERTKFQRYRQDRFIQSDDSKRAYGVTREHLDSLTKEQLTQVTKDDVQAWVRNASKSGTPDEDQVARGLEHLDKLQNNKLDQTEKQFKEIALRELTLGLKKKGDVQENLAKAKEMLDSWHKADPKLSALDLGAKLKEQFVRGKNGAFNSDWAVLGAKTPFETAPARPVKKVPDTRQSKTINGETRVWDGKAWVIP